MEMSLSNRLYIPASFEFLDFFQSFTLMCFCLLNVIHLVLCDVLELFLIDFLIEFVE